MDPIVMDIVCKKCDTVIGNVTGSDEKRVKKQVKHAEREECGNCKEND